MRRCAYLAISAHPLEKFRTAPIGYSSRGEGARTSPALLAPTMHVRRAPSPAVTLRSLVHDSVPEETTGGRARARGLSYGGHAVRRRRGRACLALASRNGYLGELRLDRVHALRASGRGSAPLVEADRGEIRPQSEGPGGRERIPAAGLYSRSRDASSSSSHNLHRSCIRDAPR
jgi:hypothetical protein